MNSPRIYKENAFRILGVLAETSRTTVRDIHQSLRIRARVGGLGSVNDPLCFLESVERSEASIRDAFNRLEDPKVRLRERLFWFSNNTSADNEAITRLIAKDMQGAVHHWESATDIGSDANLARLYHAFCIIRDPDAEDVQLWGTTFAKWRTTLESDDFWAQFIDLELESGFEPLATIGDINTFREEASSFVIDGSRSLLREAVDSQRNEVARRHLDLVRSSGFPSSILHRIEVETLESFETHIEQTAQEIQKKMTGSLDEEKDVARTIADSLEDKEVIDRDEEASSKLKREICDQAYHSYRTDLFPQLETLVQLAGSQSESFNRVVESVAECLRHIAIRYNNDTIEYRTSESLLKEALSLKPDGIVAERIKDNLTTVSGNAQKPWIDQVAKGILETLSEGLKANMSLGKKWEVCDQAYRSYREDLFPQLEGLAHMVGLESESFKQAREAVALCLRSIAIRYHNDAEDSQTAESLLKEAMDLAPDSIAAERIKEDLKTVCAHAQAEQFAEAEKETEEKRTWQTRSEPAYPKQRSSNPKPTNKAPSLYTLRGCGTTLYGKTDYDNMNKSYLTTLYFVIFCIPLFPMARYRVINEGGNTYRFLDKAPLRDSDKWHRGILACCFVGLVVIAGLNSQSTSSRKSPLDLSGHKSSQQPGPSSFVSPGGQAPLKPKSDRSDVRRFKREDIEEPETRSPYRSIITALKAQIESGKTRLETMKLDVDQRDLELQNLSSTIESYKNKIELYAEKLKQMERENKVGDTIDQNEYNTERTRHNYYVQLHNADLEEYRRKADGFNRLVDEYNGLVEDTKDKIHQYNRLIGAP